MDILVPCQEICLGVWYMIDRALGARNRRSGTTSMVSVAKTSTPLIDSGDALSIS